MKLYEIEITTDLNKVDKKYRELFKRSVEDMKLVYESQDFLDAFKTEIAQYKKRLEGELSKWKLASEEEILNHFFQIKEGKGKIEFEIETYYTVKRVIGYGVGSDDITRVNTKYLSSYNIDDPYDRMAVGSNLTHEKGHDRDFDHDFNSTSRRPNSISYILNDAFEMAYKKLILNVIEPEKEKICYRPFWGFGIIKKCYYK